jgi:hypothetical protein
VEDEEAYNQCDDVPFIVNIRRINIIETKISYSNVIPYEHTNGEGKMFTYSTSLHILYVLVQCNMDIMSLNIYVLFHNQCTMSIFYYLY